MENASKKHIERKIEKGVQIIHLNTQSSKKCCQMTLK